MVTNLILIPLIHEKNYLTLNISYLYEFNRKIDYLS